MASQPGSERLMHMTVLGWVLLLVAFLLGFLIGRR